MVAHLQIHVLHLSVESLELRLSHLFMLDLIGLYFCNFIMHNMEDVFVLSFLVEYCISQLISVNRDFLELLRFFFQDGLRFDSENIDRFNEVATDHLDARFYIEPVKLVDFVRLETIIKPILSCLIIIQFRPHLRFDR